MDTNELRNRFAFHPARTPGRAADHEGVRDVLLGVAVYLDQKLPDGREKSTAITKLEEAMMWANAGIARQG